MDITFRDIENKNKEIDELKKELWQINQENKELKARFEQQSKEIEKLYNDTHFLQSKLLEEKDISNKYWVKLVQLEQENKTLKRRDSIG